MLKTKLRKKFLELQEHQRQIHQKMARKNPKDFSEQSLTTISYRKNQ